MNEENQENYFNDNKPINFDTITVDKLNETNNELVDYIDQSGETVAAELISKLVLNQKTEQELKPAQNPYSSKLLKVNQAILEKLTEIEENMIDEQDTSIKKASDSAPMIQEYQKFSEGKIQDDSSGFGLGGLLGMVPGGLGIPRSTPKPTPTKPAPTGAKPTPTKPASVLQRAKNVAGKVGSGARTAGRFLGRLAGPAAAVGLGVYEGYTGWNTAEDEAETAREIAKARLDAGEISEKEYQQVLNATSLVENVDKSEAVGKGAGGASGAIAGAAAGAAIGSVVPIVGTFIGGVVGGTLGYLGGSMAGEEAGSIAGESVNADEIAERYKDIIDHDIIGDSDVEDWEKLSQLDSWQIQEIIGIDDWSTSDLAKMERFKQLAEERETAAEELAVQVENGLDGQDGQDGQDGLNAPEVDTQKIQNIENEIQANIDAIAQLQTIYDTLKSSGNDQGAESMAASITARNQIIADLAKQLEEAKQGTVLRESQTYVPPTTGFTPSIDTRIENYISNKISTDQETSDILNAPMPTGDIVEYIKQNEGLRLEPYKDTLGYWTIGYGHLIRPEDQWMMDGITQEQADQIFAHDYEEHMRAASNIPGWNNHPQEVKDVLVDMTFNMGPAWYKSWPNTMAALESGDYKSAAQGIMQSRYATQVGRRARQNASIIYNAGTQVAKSSSTQVVSNVKVSDVYSPEETQTQQTNEAQVPESASEANKEPREIAAMQTQQSLNNNTRVYDSSVSGIAQAQSNTPVIGINNNITNMQDNENVRPIELFSS